MSSTPSTKNKLNVVCAGCHAVNRVPQTRIGESPICGRCKSMLFPEHPIELSDENFGKFISKSEITVIVDFWASWCGPCRRMAPEFAGAASQLTPQFLFAKLSTEVSPQSASPFNIAGIPCLIAFQNGKEVARQSGFMSSDQIVQWARSI